jgi:hypothetical protein
MKTKKQKNEVFFLLEGGIYICERKNGKVVTKDEIDGKTVLELLVHAVENGLKYCTEKDIKLKD